MFTSNWSTDAIAYLRENYKILSFDELCIRLDRTEHSVRWKAKQLQLTIPRVDYTPEDDAFILANHKKGMSIQEIADTLGRTHSGVNKRITKIAIKKVRNYNRMLSDIENEVPIDENIAESYRYMMDKLDIGQSFVYPSKHRQHIANQKIYFPKKKFMTKKINASERRIWRII